MTARCLAAMALAATLAACGNAHEAIHGKDQARAGATVITRMACGSCHVIPGIEGADGHVGPPLAHFARRRTIAGVLANTPANLAAFLKAPSGW